MGKLLFGKEFGHLGRPPANVFALLHEVMLPGDRLRCFCGRESGQRAAGKLGKRLEETERIPERMGFWPFGVGYRHGGASSQSKTHPHRKLSIFRSLCSLFPLGSGLSGQTQCPQCAQEPQSFVGLFFCFFLIIRSKTFKFVHEERSLRITHFEKLFSL